MLVSQLHRILDKVFIHFSQIILKRLVLYGNYIFEIGHFLKGINAALDHCLYLFLAALKLEIVLFEGFQDKSMVIFDSCLDNFSIRFNLSNFLVYLFENGKFIFFIINSSLKLINFDRILFIGPNKLPNEIFVRVDLIH